MQLSGSVARSQPGGAPWRQLGVHQVVNSDKSISGERIIIIVVVAIIICGKLKWFVVVQRRKNNKRCFCVHEGIVCNL